MPAVTWATTPEPFVYSMPPFEVKLASVVVWPLGTVKPPFAVIRPVAVRALLTVVVPVEAPKDIAVAAPPKFKVVTVELSRLKVVAVLVMSPPFTAKSPVKVVFPVTASVEDRVVAPVTPSVLVSVVAPVTARVPPTETLSPEFEGDRVVPLLVHQPCCPSFPAGLTFLT